MGRESETTALPAIRETICLSPEYGCWRELLIRNRDVLSTFATSRSRQELLRIAQSYTGGTLGLHARLDASESVIVTGHQANWHHSGILAKDIAACGFARDTNGCTVHLVLDHDITDTSIMLPAQREDGTWHRRKVAVSSLPGDLVDVARTFPADSLCNRMWLHRANLREFTNTADAITYLHAVLHSALGLKMLYLPVSLVSESEAFMDFACSIISNAASFAEAYNIAIEDHVRLRNINRKCTLRPLSFDNEAHLIELPLWLVNRKGTRTSIHVSGEGDRIIIGERSRSLGSFDVSGANAAQLKSILKTDGYSIRPKAVTLTLFARLYLADWFVHGLGAAAYEYITEHILADFYQFAALAFGTATATMTLPLTQRIKGEDVGRRKSRKSMETVNERGFFFGLFSEKALRKLADTMPRPRAGKGDL